MILSSPYMKYSVSHLYSFVPRLPPLANACGLFDLCTRRTHKMGESLVCEITCAAIDLRSTGPRNVLKLPLALCIKQRSIHVHAILVFICCQLNWLFCTPMCLINYLVSTFSLPLSSTHDFANQALRRLVCSTGAKVNVSMCVGEGESLGMRL